MRTDAQNEALIQVRDILTEHFESAVLIISTEVEDKQDALDRFCFSFRFIRFWKR
jgi:hypothetical protein